MASIRYLNVILTLLTLVLALQLWTSWTGQGSATVVRAQGGAFGAGPAGAAGGGIPDVGAQNMQIIDLLKQLVQKTEVQTELWRSGKVHVHVDKDPADAK
jgi:hypothetical protein